MRGLKLLALHFLFSVGSVLGLLHWRVRGDVRTALCMLLSAGIAGLGGALDAFTLPFIHLEWVQALHWRVTSFVFAVVSGSMFPVALHVSGNYGSGGVLVDVALMYALTLATAVADQRLVLAFWLLFGDWSRDFRWRRLMDPFFYWSLAMAAARVYVVARAVDPHGWLATALGVEGTTLPPGVTAYVICELLGDGRRSAHAFSPRAPVLYLLLRVLFTS